MGSQYNYSRLGLLSTAPITFSGSGDTIVIALVASNRILVDRIWLVSGGSTNLTFKDGAGTSLSGAVPLSANGGLTFDLSGEPWFITSLGNDFVINSSSAVQVSGQVYYHLGT